MASEDPDAYSEGERYSEEECFAVLDRMFPDGLDGEDVLRELAPDGWEKSPLLAIFHPSVERLYEEAVRMHRNIERMLPPEKRGESPEPTLESVRAEHCEPPVEPAKECRELVGRCLWDIFSDNHEVLDTDGRPIDLGSFRASAGFIADYLNRCLKGTEEDVPPEPPDLSYLADLPGFSDPANLAALSAIFAKTGPYGYMDFYMGTIWVRGRADLGPVYELIFRRIQSLGLDWVYHFPRLNLVDMRPLAESLKDGEDGEPDFASYDPSEALAKEQEQAEHDAEVERLREDLDQAHRESVERAAAGPPPDTVAAYQRVHGRLPRGWPPA